MTQLSDIPILTAGDFCRCALTNGEQHCILGWLDVCHLFGRNAMAAIESAACKCGFNPDERIVDINNDPRNSLELLAEIWNRARPELIKIKQGGG